MKAPPQDSLGLYVSVPFCRSKCTYCNFASDVYPAGEHARYIARVAEEMTAARAWAARIGAELSRAADSVYLGGGTPTLLAPKLLEQLFAAMRAEFDVEPDAEITVECAPGTLSDDTLAAMAAAGVNRVSLGVQSFIDHEAAVSGRLHSRATALDDMRRLRAAGMANLSVDLIAGLPGQTLASWRESLAVLVDCGVSHASVYMLEVDEDSRLGRELLAHGARYHAGLVPSDDAIVRMYSEAIETLARAGFEQYEISNFSRPGFASRHNLRYWQRRPYLGFGLDASSMLRAVAGRHAGEVMRATTSCDLKTWFDRPQPEETIWLSRARQHEEAWFLGLRMQAGVDAAAVERAFGAKLAGRALQAAARLKRKGLVAVEGRTIRLTDQGRLLSNDVFQEFLDLDALADDTCVRDAHSEPLPREQFIS